MDVVRIMKMEANSENVTSPKCRPLCKGGVAPVVVKVAFRNASGRIKRAAVQWEPYPNGTHQNRRAKGVAR